MGGVDDIDMIWRPSVLACCEMITWLSTVVFSLDGPKNKHLTESCHWLVVVPSLRFGFDLGVRRGSGNPSNVLKAVAETVRVDDAMTTWPGLPSPNIQDRKHVRRQNSPSDAVYLYCFITIKGIFQKGPAYRNHLVIPFHQATPWEDHLTTERMNNAHLPFAIKENTIRCLKTINSCRKAVNSTWATLFETVINISYLNVGVRLGLLRDILIVSIGISIMVYSSH